MYNLFSFAVFRFRALFLLQAETKNVVKAIYLYFFYKLLFKKDEKIAFVLFRLFNVTPSVFFKY